MNQQDNAVQAFFDAWEVYQKVLSFNYMYHEEIYADVGAVIRSGFPEGGYRMLDLGCGSAEHLAVTLADHPPDYYLGYDLAETALGHARENLAAWDSRLELRQGDLRDGVVGNDGMFDLVFSSFALHHLNSDEKQLFFQASAQRLAPGGLLLLIDVMRGADEPLPLYLDRYCSWIEQEWLALSAQDRAGICEHVRTKDLPETWSGLSGMATKAGFENPRQVNRFGWHRTLLFPAKGVEPAATAQRP